MYHGRASSAEAFDRDEVEKDDVRQGYNELLLENASPERASGPLLVGGLNRLLSIPVVPIAALSLPKVCIPLI